MGDLIDFFLSNPFLLLLIIGGLVSMFNRKEGKEQTERTRPVPKPRPTLNRAELPNIPKQRRDTRSAPPMPTREEYRQRRVDEQPQIDREPVIETIEPAAVELHYEDQLDELKKQLGVVEQRKKPQQSELQERILKRNTVRTLAVEQQQFKKQFKNNVSPSGLVHSVIMAEVLGPPRGLKPYESTRYRYQKK